MTEQNKPMKIEFAPGCFDHFEGTQEELDQLQKEILDMFTNMTSEELEASGTIVTADNFDELPESVQKQIARVFLEDDDELPDDLKRQIH